MTRKDVLRKGIVLFILTSVFSCVTINIYFPAEEVKKAAEEIVKDIREKQQNHQEPSTTSPSPQKEGSRKNSFFVLIQTSEAYAQSETTVSNAAIRELKSRMRARQSKLAPFYAQGVIGENSAGYIDLLDVGKLDMKNRAEAQRLVNAENQDRKQLYQEVARALNVDPSQVGRIGSIFAQEWQKTASPGWMIQQPGGNWNKK